jgi:hypothetical protein
MIIASINIRGLGGAVKRKYLKELVRKENIEFLAIQETKLDSITDNLCHSLWGGDDCNWAFLPSVGNSGGILSIWSSSAALLLFSFVGEGFVGVCLEWGPLKKVCFVINVYSSCDLNGKRRLWESLVVLKRQYGRGAWGLIGDFNATLNQEERRGVNAGVLSSARVEVAEFGDFVRDMELIDLPLVGRNFTWFHPNGISMSRIDRFLVSDDWLGIWNNPVLWVLPRTISDHCTLLLKPSCVDWGPKPFRFNNHWILHKDFYKLVEDFWRNCEFTGWMAFILKEKLKGLKGCLRSWNKETFGSVEVKINKLVGDIRDLDVRSEVSGLSAGEVLHRKDLFAEMWKLRMSRESMLTQRSRQTWLREGDSNTRYFHSCITSRNRSNFISALRVGNDWIETPAAIRQETVNYFKRKFCSEDWERPNLDGVSFPSLGESENQWLIRPFELAEIERVIKDCDGNKSPGPDGFNFAFLKAIWNVCKGEIRIMFDQFHGIGSLPKCFSSYFVTLIPKVHSPSTLGDFRPISLLGCLYKIIAKVLTTRLASVIDKLVASTQSAFIKGRHLVDGVVVINEVVDLARRNGQSCLIFKVDFEKAYDSVEWSFLDYMLDRFGFCAKWKEWIRACVFAGNMSVLINGSPSEEINIQRGLKQGDPLAPFLFLLVAEGLGGLMKKAVDLNRFRGFRVGNGEVIISHLQYADDTLCVGEASIENLWTLKAILRGFELASGLKVNFWKSSLMGLNVSQEFMSVASSFLNCKVSSIPFVYLGLPVGANPRRLSTWEPLLVSLRKRLGMWGNKFVSLGGRIVLLNAVLNAIPVFYLSYLKIPIQVWKKVRRIQREFLWGGRRGSKKINWIKWETVCLPKNKGGLGVRDIRVVNISLLTKWRWRLLDSTNAVWKDVIKCKYGEVVSKRVELGEECMPWFASLWWKDICTIGNNFGINWFSSNMVKLLGNGALSSFWFDIWVGDSSLKNRFPRLFSISSQKEASVADVRNLGTEVNNWGLLWRRRLFVWEENLVVELLDLINTVALSDSIDKWGWRPEKNADFSVKSTYLSVSNLSNLEVLKAHWHGHIFSCLWKTPSPSKVCGFVWQMLHDRIPTKGNLVSRRIIAAGEDSICALCRAETETTHHLLLYCSFAKQVWYEIFNWLQVPFGLPHSLFSIFNCLLCAGNLRAKKGRLMICCAVVWMIWKFRNSVLFENGSGSVSDVVESVKVASWKWWLAQAKTAHCLLYEWKAEPCVCLLY